MLSASALEGGGRDVERFLLFSGVDLWRGGGFAHAGLLWSPGGLDREGLTVKTLIGGGTYRYASGASVIVGTQRLLSFLPGWRVRSGTFEATVFLGVDDQHHALAPDDPASRLRGHHTGVRTGADLWWEPAPDTMVSASLWTASIGHGYWVRVAAGQRLSGLAYVGPEVVACGSGDYRQLRAGVHLTALRTGALEWSAGVGWLTDAETSGLYARLGLLARR